MNLSRHALDRWCNRFPDLKLYDEWSKAKQRRPSKKLINRLRKQTTIVKGYRYWITPTDIVFVVSCDDRVVTVFKMHAE